MARTEGFLLENEKDCVQEFKIFGQVVQLVIVNYYLRSEGLISHPRNIGSPMVQSSLQHRRW